MNDWGELKGLADLYFETAEKEAEYAKRRTGFNNLDGLGEFKADGQKQIFVPGIYVIGAPSSMGKTTICLQLLTKLADLGEQCLFISYEMGELSLFRKMIACDLFIKKQKGEDVTLISAANIRRAGREGTVKTDIKAVVDDLACLNSMRVKYVDWDSSTLIKKLNEFAKTLNRPPVVCVDYLQLVPAPTKSTMTAKERIDGLLSDLRKFQNDTSSTLILISSLNRASMKQDNGITLSSFKESGNIEYAADIVWALEPAIAYNETFSEAAQSEREKKIRAMQLRCLKSREDALFKVFFHYYAEFDCFVPCAEDKVFAEPECNVIRQ